MKLSTKLSVFLTMVIAITVIGASLSYSQLAPGKKAPLFTLKDTKGVPHDLSKMGDQPMVILYFFDVESRPSQEGLLSLDQLAKQYRGSNLIVWAITLSPEEKVAGFQAKTNHKLPILSDGSGVSDLYHAKMILPTVCILGPGLKVLDYIQGGGKTTETMLVRLAGRELQRKEIRVAKVISEQVIKKNPGNLKARTVKGYAALKEGNLDDAEKTFRNLSKQKGQGETLGKEGLAAVYAKKGQAEKALNLAKEVEQKAHERSYVHVIKGDILYSQGKKKEAEAEYNKAVKKKTAEPYQKAVAYNQLGRIQANHGKYKKARELYDQAVAIDPYYIEATSNKGITYEKEGKWDKALGSYRQALTLDKNDTFAVVLARKAQEMLSLQKNTAEKKRIDKLVKELAGRYRSGKESVSKTSDEWTSRPMIMSFVDFQEKGGLSERDGFSTILTTQLADHLNGSGRVRVVERVLIERLLEELNLGSSDLADPETALRLGKVLAAKVIGTGALFYLTDGALLSLRLIDTETSAIPRVITRQIGSRASLEKELYRLNREILETIITKYPLRGYVVQVTGKRVMINLGSNQGVVPGTKFEILEEQEPIKYKGKLLKGASRSIAEIKVSRVEPDLCYARILKQERDLKRDDRVKEKMEDIVTGGSK